MLHKEHSPQIKLHIEEVLQPPLSRDSLILASWQRCTYTHQLDPTTPQKAVVLSASELRCHQDEVEDMMHTARMGMEALYQQIHQIGYVVLLTNGAGITVDFIGDRTFDNQLRKSGLYLGSDWNEEHAGTCAVGTCIESKQAVVVHQTDHFDASHINLTCSAAPIYAPDGRLSGVLDISSLRSPEAKESQHMALRMVQIYSERIERSYFLHHFCSQLVFSFSHSPDFVDVVPEYLLATNASGVIIGFNNRFKQEVAQQSAILGQSLEDFFHTTLDELLAMQHLPGYQRVIRTSRLQQPVFVQIRLPVGQLNSIPHTIKPDNPLDAFHGGDARLQMMTGRLLRLINSRVNIILGGETGTGKEYLASMIHQSSARSDKPFIAINCAAIPESLIESELFGYEQGAFTGGKRGGRVGLIEQANGGTLFLDEIGDMPLLLQTRLLRVLAEKELYPLGGSKKISLNLHVISATHQNLKTLITDGLFRADLYYRLSGAEFELPPLRERSDFDWLLQRILDDLQTNDNSKNRDLHFRAQIMEKLKQYHWPGNIRELKNLLSYLDAVKSDSDQLVELSDLPEDIALLRLGLMASDKKMATTIMTDEVASTSTKITPDNDEAMQLQLSLQRHHWNISATARALSVARMTIYRRMKRLGIVLPNWVN
jgi:transcriptional regulator of acetoin/glycerol metabolism